MSQVIKGNRPLRIFASLVIVMIVVAHVLGQIDLTENWIFWILLFMAANALQASFTGFCPMFKNAKGECVACGVACDTPKAAENKSASKSACCDESSGCCDDKKEPCCSPKETAGCCDDKKEPCCSPKETAGCCDDKAEPCCDSKASSSCCDGEANDKSALAIKVLGTGCANCNNTVKLIETVANELDVKVSVHKVEDIAEIAAYGVMSTPAVVINEVVVHSGGVPSKALVTGWLTGK